MANAEGSSSIKITTFAKEVLDGHLKKYPYTQIGFATKAILDAIRSDEKRLNRKSTKK